MQVYAFEPQRLMFQTLLGNAALNSLTNIYGFQKALSNAPGKLLVPLQDCEKEVNWGGLALGSCSEGEEVEVITIDSLKLSACDFIKVDVEGMELPVLQGAAENLVNTADPVCRKRPCRKVAGIGGMDKTAGLRLVLAQTDHV
mgnify:CR=1 FL=1